MLNNSPHLHTPGPWFADDGMGNIPGALAITAGERIDGPEYQREHMLAEVYAEDANDPNVRLVVASPDMLAALKMALRHVRQDALEYSEGDHGERIHVLDVIRAAIAKAGG